MDRRARPLVLVCDDEAGPRLAMTCMLADACEVVTAETVDAAVRACQARQFDVAIVDWTLPSTADGGESPAADGEAVQALLGVDVDLAVVVWSAHGARIEQAALALGAQAMISKPISPDSAMQCVDAAATATAERRAASAAQLAVRRQRQS